MIKPNFAYEKKLIKSGLSRICGIDEVGRGPLAGPVVASAVWIDASLIMDDKAGLFGGINESKKLSASQRERWFAFLTNEKAIKYAIGIVSEKIIDEINILEATKLAMSEAFKKLIRQLADKQPDFILIDGNFTLENIDLNQKAIPQGDAKVISIAAASIIAKVTRDRIMEEYQKKYPVYGFAKHKGYGTKKHMEALKKNGICAIHRRSFAPVKGMTKL